MTADEYEVMGEFHDLFMAEPWQKLAPFLTDALAHVKAGAVVVDIGAGSGVGTRHIAAATAADIIAIEPSLTMRTVLTARIADDTRLRPRVTIIAGAVPTALGSVPGPVAGFVAAHVIGHLTAAERRTLFQRLADRATADAVGVITVPVQGAHGHSDEVLRIGRYDYVARYLPPDATGRPSVEYSVRDGHVMLRRERVSTSWAAPTREELSAELQDAGWVLSVPHDSVGLVRRAPVTA